MSKDNLETAILKGWNLIYIKYIQDLKQALSNRTEACYMQMTRTKYESFLV